MTDGLSILYQDLLSGSYDCVDRIVLNGYFRMGHDPGGFRVWWRVLTGSDETLDNAHLMRLAGRFSRRVRGYAKAHNIPVIDCSRGERKHQIAEEYLTKTTVTQGISAPSTTSSDRSRYLMSTTTRFISSIPNGVISPSSSAGILHSRRK
jgi:hypothetical protein